MLRRILICGVWVSAIALWLTAFIHAAPASGSLIDAVRQGNQEAVRALLKNGADVNQVEGDGMTALHWAAVRADRGLAKMLLFAGANVRATTRIGGYTPLLMASRNGSADLIEELVSGGADVDDASTNGTTPLMFAAASGKVEAVKALLDLGADVNAKENGRGETALAFAAAYGRADVVRALADYGADLETTTTVLDLSPFAREEIERQEQQQQRQRQQQSGGRGRGGVAPAQGGESSGRQREGGEPTSVESREPAAPPAGSGKESGAQSADAGKEPEPKTAARGAAGSRSAEPASRTSAEGKEAAAKASPKKPQVAGVDRRYLYTELVGVQGGLAPLHLAARQGYVNAVVALLDAGADINQPSAADKITPLIIATINGHFDLARLLLDRGADPKLAEDNGVTALYAALNCEWAPKALYPQPRAYLQQNTTYLDLMKALLAKGADPNVRLKRKVWYTGYDFDLSGVDETGATPFWRAAYASDVDGMRLLISNGADPNIPTIRTPGRPRTGDAEREAKDVSGLPPVPVGGPGVPALVAAAGTGYGEGFAANSHRFAPAGMLPAVKYLVEELHADVNARDHEGNTALHDAAARGDNEMIQYLVSKGADVKVVNREGKTTADMANGPVQRIQPFPDTIKLLEGLGAKNNHKCVSC